MSIKKWKLAAVLLWSGAALLILGLVFSYQRLRPFVETMAYSSRIPTAPSMAVSPPLTTTPVALLPFQTPAEVMEGDSSGDEADDAEDSASMEAPVAEGNSVVLTPVAEAEPAVEDVATATPTPTPEWPGTVPTHLVIPAINLDAPVVPIGSETVMIEGEAKAQWSVPDQRAAGWHDTSAMLGKTGNTVFNGHNTSRGEVFRDLYKLEVGAEVFVHGEDGQVYKYIVGEKYILREAGQSLSTRLENARYILKTSDERLTMVTCHPYGSLANRLVIISYPAPNEGVDAAPGVLEEAN